MKQLNVAILALAFLGVAFPQEENSLTRDEVGSIKRKLVAVLEALGGPPAGYAIADESFSLPTEAYETQTSGRYQPLNSSANRKYGSAAEKKAKKTGEELEKDYQKKMMEAQAKGDYQTMQKLALEMQQKAGQAQMEAVEGKKDPIEVYVNLNSNPYQTIDPDAVVFESAGVIGLRFKDDVEGTQGRVTVYFDPVNLKDTRKLSKVDMKQPEDGVQKKTAVLNVTIDIKGPMPEIEAWAKNIASKKVLAQID